MPPKADVEVIKKVTMMPLSSSIFGTAGDGGGDQEKGKCRVCNMFSNLFWLTNICYSTAWQDMNDILLNNDYDELLKGVG